MTPSTLVAAVAMAAARGGAASLLLPVGTHARGLWSSDAVRTSPVQGFIRQVSLALGRKYSAAAEGVGESAPAREQMNYDVCIVGAGPAGLGAAIRIKQKCKEAGKDISVCVVDKGSSVGAHILSGCVMDPRALNELFPEWKDDPTCPVGKQPATRDLFYALPTSSMALRLPLAPTLKNKGNYIVSLSEVTRWLATKAEELGVEVYPGFAAKRLLFHGNGHVEGVATNDFGVSKSGQRKATFTPGVDLKARVTLLAEGARGSLSQVAIKRYQLRNKVGADRQTYGLGIKEVWEVPEAVHKPGTVVHTVGYPLGSSPYGGGFIYHMSDRRVALGLVVSLDYDNPYLSPYQELQRWKLHPTVKQHIEGGSCIQYGARTINEGGFQSIPQLHFPGGALIGCSAGFLNVARIKGSHTALLSGMTAAEAVFRALTAEDAPAKGPVDLARYQAALQHTWLWDELKTVRNVRPGFRFGLIPGILHAALDTYVLRGKEPWTLRNRHADHEKLRPAAECKPIDYPKPDGKVTFDLPMSLYRSGTNHEHDQPAHLQLRDAGAPERYNYKYFAGPESRYCPAGVYEYTKTEDEHGGRVKLTINAQNCLHCKACDIKDPLQNINWTVPEGGGGPNYTVM